MRKLVCIFMGLSLFLMIVRAQEDERSKKIESRMVGSKEIDPMYWADYGEEHYCISELGVELIWNNELKMLYVLKRVYYIGTKVNLNGKMKNIEMPMTVISDIFMIGDEGRERLCLGKAISSGKEYWIEAVKRLESLEVVIDDNEGEVIFSQEWKSEN